MKKREQALYSPQKGFIRGRSNHSFASLRKNKEWMLEELKEQRPLSCRCNFCGMQSCKDKSFWFRVEVSAHRHKRITNSVIQTIKDMQSRRSGQRKTLKIGRASLVVSQKRLTMFKQQIMEQRRDEEKQEQERLSLLERRSQHEESVGSLDIAAKLQSFIRKNCQLSLQRVYSQTHIKLKQYEPLSQPLSQTRISNSPQKKRLRLKSQDDKPHKNNYDLPLLSTRKLERPYVISNRQHQQWINNESSLRKSQEKSQNQTKKTKKTKKKVKSITIAKSSQTPYMISKLK